MTANGLDQSQFEEDVNSVSEITTISKKFLFKFCFPIDAYNRQQR